MAKKLYGTDPDQVPTNADLGTTAYTNVQAMPKVVIGEPQEGIRFVDPYDNYALRINGNEYYSSGAKLSRTGSGSYTGTLQFEKIKTDADGNAVDGKSGDRLLQIYSTVTNDAGAFCDGPSITGDLLADVGSATQSTGRINFIPNGGSGVIASIDSDGLKFNGDTAAANALDDYEEGSWSPHIKDSYNDATKISATSQGSYTKIGNVLHFAINIYANGVASTTFTGYPYITLPFTPASGGHNAGTVVYIGYFNGIGTATQAYLVGSGSPSIRFSAQLTNPYGNSLSNGDTWGGNVRLYFTGSVILD